MTKASKRLSDLTESLSESFAAMPIVPMGGFQRRAYTPELPSFLKQEMEYGDDSDDSEDGESDIASMMPEMSVSNMEMFKGMSNRQIVEMMCEMSAKKMNEMTTDDMDEYGVIECMNECVSEMMESRGKKKRAMKNESFGGGRLLLITPSLEESYGRGLATLSEFGESICEEFGAQARFSDGVLRLRVPHSCYDSVMRMARAHSLNVRG